MEQHLETLTYYIERLASGDAGEIPESIVEEFGEKCKDTLRKLGEPRSEFRLRMSNIGSTPRSLWLDSVYGRKVDPKMVVKGTYGHLVEHFFMALMKASGVPFDSVSGKTTLMVGDTEVNGEYDAIIDGRVYDFKTASPYSYDNKFNSFDTIAKDDDFGYCGQGVAYSQGTGKLFGGWFVIHLVTGEYKYVSGNELNNLKVRNDYLEDFENKVRIINGEIPPPPCTGVVNEVFNRKETGRKVLGFSCTYCNHKDKCHKNITYMPSLASKAKSRPWKYYVDLDKTTGVSSNESS